jgi:hypothetical protein
MSRINPITKQPEYVLPSGIVVPANEQTRNALVSGKSDFQVLAVSKSSGGGSSSSKSGSLLNQSSTLNQSVSSNQTQSDFGKKIQSTQQTPLGTPQAEVKKPWYKKAGELQAISFQVFSLH